MIRRCRPLLGTFVEIGVPEGTADAIIDAAFDAIAYVHQRMSFHEHGSDLAKLRRAPLQQIIEVDAATVTVLRAARKLYEASHSLFDVTIGRDLVRNGFLPRAGVTHLNRYNGNTAAIEIVDDTHVLLRQGVLIDLGGIAKGYAVDCAVESLTSAGVTHGIVNAGGDLRVFGDAPQVVHIRGGNGTPVAQLTLKNSALASSANALDRRRLRGKSLTPHIGPQHDPVLIDETVSVMASTCMIADAMTKVAMTDPALADRLLEAHKGYVIDFNQRIAA